MNEREPDIWKDRVLVDKSGNVQMSPIDWGHEPIKLSQESQARIDEFHKTTLRYNKITKWILIAAIFFSTVSVICNVISIVVNHHAP